MNELALFAGAGGGILGGKLLGWRTVCAVEREAYCASVLSQRQADGLLEAFPIWSDVTTFDGHPWRGIVDVVSGGFPCQDISVAGKGKGIDGERSGLWKHMARIVSEVRPRFVFVKNSPAILIRGFGVVISDLAALGYDCRWTVLGAADVGAPHQRDRFWLVATDTLHRGYGIDVQQVSERGSCSASHVGRDGETQSVANTDGSWKSQPTWCEQERGMGIEQRGEAMANANTIGRNGRAGESGSGRRNESANSGAIVANTSTQRLSQSEQALLLGTRWREEGRAASECSWWLTEPDVGRVANGVANRVDRLKALGNGQVPVCAATAWRMLTGSI